MLSIGVATGPECDCRTSSHQVRGDPWRSLTMRSATSEWAPRSGALRASKTRRSLNRLRCREPRPMLRQPPEAGRGQTEQRRSGHPSPSTVRGVLRVEASTGAPTGTNRYSVDARSGDRCRRVPQAAEPGRSRHRFRRPGCHITPLRQVTAGSRCRLLVNRRMAAGEFMPRSDGQSGRPQSLWSIAGH
jgi:hypothetical protein